MKFTTNGSGFVPAVISAAAVAMVLQTHPVRAQQAETAIPPELQVPPGQLSTADIPFFPDWAVSPHADRSAEPFTHWNEEGAVPADCAKCHSTPGFRDFVGVDGTQAGVVDHPAPIGSVITCMACHNPATMTLNTVTFPSGVTVADLGREARCMTCHQGRESSDSVSAALTGLEDDAVSDKLGFVNVHYAAAGATLMGSVARGAYQYPGKDYVGQLTHPEPFSSCITCHDPHTTDVKVEECVACHRDVTDEASLRNIRIGRGARDYDGDGDATEGIAAEIDGMHGLLYAAIQSYAADVAGTPIVYDGHAYPYFFADSNGNGEADADELKFPNQYKAWTPRLLRAAYNYQFVEKDPGGFAHNAPYMLQIMFDSIENLAGKADVQAGSVQRP